MATKEELLLRALDTSNMAVPGNGDTSHVHEDLSDLITMITPTDVPLFSRLARTKATALLHEWTEASHDNVFTDAKYVDGGMAADTTNNHVRKSNKVMSLGRVAKATNLLRALNMVGQQEALAKEMEEKMLDLMRAIEYYIWNGDQTAGGAPELDGILKRVVAGNGSTVVSNGAAKLVEDNLKKVIVGIYNQGGSPTTIYARPEVAYQIANFTTDKIRYAGPGTGAGGVGSEALRYLSPFGKTLEIVPVRSDFLASGNVLVLDDSKFKLAFASNGIEIDDIPLAVDAKAKLLKAYLTLETRGLQHAGRLTGVLD
jgi:hypothetical protein